MFYKEVVHISSNKFLIILGWITFSILLYWCSCRVENRNIVLDGEEIFEQSNDSMPVQAEIPTENNIRVLIKTNNYESIYHSDIIVTCDEEMEIVLDGITLKCSANEKYDFTCDATYDNAIITSLNDGRIEIINLSRNAKAQYAGNLELYFTDKGIVVVNELPIEEYLYGVVPSEMPTTYPLEALKAQAVSARTYTYYHMGDYAYPEWSAHLDDSTTYQVYMNNAVDEKAIQAVNETSGLVLTYEGEIVESFYYSTSGGYNGALAVWNSLASGIKGSHDSYLIETGNELFATNTVQGEAAYKSYIDEGDSGDVEYEEAWYRWTYDKTISDNDLYNLLKTIYSQSQAQSEYIEIVSPSIKSIENLIYESKITDIQIINRQKSGLVTQLSMSTPNYQITISTQYVIRQILGSLGGNVVRNDNSTYTLNNMLPSAYFYLTYNDNHLTINGAGFGHGCGMSQNGAKNLANEGYTFDEILGYYYNAEITQY